MSDTGSLAVLHSSDAKSEIVKVLASTWPLSARQIFQQLRSRQGREISYQGVHKAVRQMQESGILVKKEKGYSLNATWLREAKKFVDVADAKYSGKSVLSLEDVASGESATLSFDCYWNALFWILCEMDKVYQKRDLKNIAATFWYHPWPIIALSESEFSKLNFVVKNSLGYTLCPSTYQLDRVMSEFWKKVGAFHLMGVSEQRGCEEITVYEWLVQVYPSKKVLEDLESLYKKKTGFDADTLDKLYEIIYRKDNKTGVVIVRNPEIADGVREKVLKFFNKKLKQGAPQSVV